MKRASGAERIRKASGLPRYRIALRAQASDATARLYEIDRLAVEWRTRERFDQVYRELLIELRARVAALPNWPPKSESIDEPARREPTNAG